MLVLCSGKVQHVLQKLIKCLFGVLILKTNKNIHIIKAFDSFSGGNVKTISSVDQSWILIGQMIVTFISIVTFLIKWFKKKSCVLCVNS